MKAIVLEKYGSPDDLHLREVEKPLPNDDEVLIKVKAVSVNDWDWSMVCGKPFYIRLLCGLTKPKIRIPGVDVAGVVETAGKNVTRFQPGEAVYGDLSECGFGGFAEYVCAPESAMTIKPQKMTFAEAAALPHAATLAMQGLIDAGKIQPGHKLLINGAGGGAGTLGIQIARHLGIKDISGVDSSGKLEMMRTLGATHTIDYSEEDFTCTGEKYDVIFDPKTNRSPFRYLRALKPGGIYATVGGQTGRLIQMLLLGPLIRLFSKKKFQLVALKPNKDLDFINQLFESGKIKPFIEGPFQLSDAPDAIRLFGEGKHKGKVVIELGHNK